MIQKQKYKVIKVYDDGKILKVKIPRGSSGDEIVEQFDLILKFMGFLSSTKEIVTEDVIHEYYKELNKNKTQNEE